MAAPLSFSRWLASPSGNSRCFLASLVCFVYRFFPGLFFVGFGLRDAT